MSFARQNGAAPRGRNLKILVLGGTGFLGPAFVEAARARGHTLTLFNRGRTEKRKEEVYGEPVFPDIEKIYGNRDPLKHAVEEDPTSPKGLTGLEGDRTWDAVFDTSGYVPRIVRASAELLKGRVAHYTFISTVSVYKENSQPGGDESREIGTIPDTTVEEMGASFENYGPLKALCEQAAESVFPGKTLRIRPGLICGPGDPTDRFTYWPVRIAKGGDVLAPGEPIDPIQIIDVRDLAEFALRCIEAGTVGVYNALGPEKGLTIGGLLDACKAVAFSDATFHWADAAFLAEHGVAPWAHMPVWIPPIGDTAGFHTWKTGASERAGLTFRPIADTCKATLDWWNKLPEKRRTDPMRAGLTAEREKEVLAALKAR